MNRPHRHRRVPFGKARSALSAALFAVAAGLFAVAAAQAFQSVREESVEVVAVTTGVFPQFLKINHTPINGGSEITKELILLVEAGFDTPPTPPPYNQRFTLLSKPPAPANQLIEIKVEYRFLAALAEGSDEFKVTDSIVGPDPLYAAFEIDPSLVTTGPFEYRILARRLTGPNTEFEALPREIDDVPRYFITEVKANAAAPIGVQGGRLRIPDGNPEDGESYLDIPRGMFISPTVVTLDELPITDPIIPQGLPDAIRMYRLDSQNAIKGQMVLTLQYPDFDYATGQDGKIDGSSLSESSVGIAFWDGFVWRYLGGIGNPNLNTVSARIGAPGYYAVVPARALAPQDQRPMEKIITPNGDGRNDVALFSFSNPFDNIKVEIFDIKGHRIRTLYSATHNGWDGADDGGQIVESGVYIYQFKSEGKLVSGLIAVAK